MKIKTNIRAGRCASTTDRCGAVIDRCGGCTRCGGITTYEV